MTTLMEESVEYRRGAIQGVVEFLGRLDTVLTEVIVAHGKPKDVHEVRDLQVFKALVEVLGDEGNALIDSIEKTLP